MSTNNEEKLRGAFEAWAWPTCIGYKPAIDTSGKYGAKEDEDMWQAFQHAYKLAWEAQQAVIDRLMLEHCPDEMTAEQVAEWKSHQKPYTGEHQ